MTIERRFAARTTGPSLGVVAISKNEIVDIGHFVANLANWVDEIVVVDDQSTDGTLEYLQRRGPPVKVVSRPLADGGFAAQRNAGIDVAESEWLLHMDVDERVPPALAAEIRNAIASTGLNAFRYPRLNFFLHRPFEAGGWQTWNAAQLGRRGKHRFVNAIHEVAIVDGGETSTGQLREKMWHLNDENFAERLRKNVQYARMSANDIDFRVSWFDLLFRPMIAGLKAYLYRGAWRYGTLGLIFSLYIFSGMFNRYVFVWEAQNKGDRAPLERKLAEDWKLRGDKDDTR